MILLSGVETLTGAEYVYDGDGTIVNSIINGVSTYYPGRHYNLEMNGTTSVAQKSYAFGLGVGLSSIFCSHQTRSRSGFSQARLPTLAMSIHSPPTFTRTTSAVKSVTVLAWLSKREEPTA